MTAYDTILVDRRDRFSIVTLNRPAVLNALNLQMMHDLVAALDRVDADDQMAATIITGSTRAFAAGADISEMASQSFADVSASDWFGGWARIARARKPLIAAVSGHALGGGCELAMMCDVIVAGDSARFGQPEIKLGVIPGIGGSQRLTRAIGKAKAMDLILTGRTIGAEEADRLGLVSRLVPTDQLLDHAIALATELTAYSVPVLVAAKEAVNRSFETPLAEGQLFERRLFHSMFALDDRSEGMAAFLEKRVPRFTDS